jgi:ferredoxin
MAIGNIIFIVCLAGAIWFFAKNVGKIRRNILLGKDEDRTDNKSERWKTMARVALGQSKMVVRPVAGLMHILIYVGFVIINIEVLEIILDGVFGSHRLFFSPLGGFYFFLINAFEVLALLVLLACVVFLARRNIVRIKRFFNPEMKGWPTSDANIILVVEIALMIAFLTMNAADAVLMNTGADQLAQAGLQKYAIGFEGEFVISQWIIPLLPESLDGLMLVERGMWWFHILGILAFLNYLPYSKHFHIILAFPNTFYSNLKSKGQFNNMEAVTKEVKLMFDPEADPYAAPAEGDGTPPEAFGAKDVTDLSWKQLMDSYSCTECGRCTSNCPANQTGKLLSPRKIMMDTRDRLNEVGKNIDKHGKDHDDGKSLLNDYITPEELWACTTCNACVESCPVNIDPLSIIMEMRRYLVMEQSAAPQELNGMFTNIENNAAPWQFAQADRLNWRDE